MENTPGAGFGGASGSYGRVVRVPGPSAVSNTKGYGELADLLPDAIPELGRFLILPASAQAIGPSETEGCQVVEGFFEANGLDDLSKLSLGGGHCWELRLWIPEKPRRASTSETK
jgi:hypothetical protein